MHTIRVGTSKNWVTRIHEEFSKDWPGASVLEVGPAPVFRTWTTITIQSTEELGEAIQDLANLGATRITVDTEKEFS